MKRSMAIYAVAAVLFGRAAFRPRLFARAPAPETP